LTAGLLAGFVVPGAAQENGDSVASRLGRLEAKVRDLQVSIGTLQSFGAKPGAVLSHEASPPPQVQASDDSLGPRMVVLETQITALTRHVEQIGKQMSALEEKISALQVAPAPPPVPAPTQDEPLPFRQGDTPIPAPEEEPLPLRQGEAPIPAPDSATASVDTASDDDYDPSKPRWFGPKPGSDELAALLQKQGTPDEVGAGQPQNIMAALPGGDARSLYQQGYGALLQKDYANAEGAFRQLIETYPNDSLAGDAQYWLGESYYVRGQYKNAADAFLSGYKKYKSGQKAPDTLLKLGMSLAELGQKDAACSTFNELTSKFPQAPKDVSDEAKTWRKKTGC
jgi:tol-pal system protein YbgF